MDGISDEFIIMYSSEFLEEYNKMNKKNKKNKKNNTSKKQKSKIDPLENTSSRLSAENAVILVEKLKKYRTEKAKESGWAPYCIYYDSTINDIISQCPINQAELMSIKGFGKTKVERYGKFIIDTCVELQC